MGLFARMAGIVGNFFQLGGPSGPGLNNNAGAIDGRNAANNAYAIMRGATPVGLGANNTTMTMAGFNSTLPSAGPAFLELVITTGTSEVLTVLNPVYCECISPGNP